MKKSLLLSVGILMLFVLTLSVFLNPSQLKPVHVISNERQKKLYFFHAVSNEYRECCTSIGVIMVWELKR